jgi:hypothetical protein
MRGRLAAVVVALFAQAAAPAAAQELRDGDAYARVDGSEVVLGNAVAERRWSRDALRTTLLADKRGGGRQWSAGRRDFTLSVAGAEIGSESFAVRAVELERVPRGGVRVRMRLAGPGLAAQRVAEAYPGIAGFRTQTILEPSAVLTLTGATLDEAAVGAATTPTIHAFRAGADWRQPGYEGPDVSVGDAHGGTWRASQTGEAGTPLEGPAQWLSAADGERSLFMVMERNDFPSSRARFADGVARLELDYTRDVVVLGPLEEQLHVENPQGGEAGRSRTLTPGRPFALEAAFTGFGDHDGDEPWQFHRYLVEHRLTPYRKAVTFNSNGTDANKISTGAKDDMDLATTAEVAELARRLGVDTFILDDGWQARSGDWQPDSPEFPEPRWDGSAESKFRPRFPDPRFEAVRDAIAPMDLGLWMSPMHFHPTSRTFAANPSWLCQPAGTALLALNTAEPESSSNEAGIVEWSTAAIGHVEARIRDGIANWGVRYFKFDFMAWLDCAGQNDVYEMHDEFLAMIDRIQADHPQVTFQIDETNDYRLFPFESVSRGPSWFQNGQPAPEQLLHNLWNLSPYVPGFSIGQDALGGENWKEHPVATLMAAALPSHITFFSDIRKLPSEVIDQARPWVDFHGRHRDVFGQMVYPLLDEPLEKGWTALQTWDPDRGRGALLAFRQDGAEAERRIALRNVPGGRRFDLLEGPTDRYVATVTSEDLRRGIDVRLAAKRDARVLLVVPARPLRLSLRARCARGRPRASVGGPDAGRVARVAFLVGGRTVARDARAPFARRLRGAHRGRRLRARAVAHDGRVVTLRARLPRCALRATRPGTRRARPKLTG